MWDDVLHNQCVQGMDVDHHTVQVEEDQVMVVDVDHHTVVDVTETVRQEINTRRGEVFVQRMVDKVVTVEKNGSLTLKEKD